MIFGTRTKEAENISAQLTAVRERVESQSAELVKTIDEMLEASNKANRRQGWRNHEDPKKSGH